MILQKQLIIQKSIEPSIVNIQSYIESLCSIIQSIQQKNDRISMSLLINQIDNILSQSRIFLESVSIYTDSQLLSLFQISDIQSKNELFGVLGEITSAMANLITHHLMLTKYEQIFHQSQLDIVLNIKLIYSQFFKIRIYFINLKN